MAFCARLLVSAVYFLRSKFSLSYALVPESRWSPGESHTEINRLSSAKAEIGFDFRIGELHLSLAGYLKKAESGRRMVPIWHSGLRCLLVKPNKYRENKHFLNKA
jgi:hypothetical protein